MHLRSIKKRISYIIVRLRILSGRLSLSFLWVMLIYLWRIGNIVFNIVSWIGHFNWPIYLLKYLYIAVNKLPKALIYLNWCAFVHNTIKFYQILSKLLLNHWNIPASALYVFQFWIKHVFRNFALEVHEWNTIFVVSISCATRINGQ